jgi:hypothetical protein
MITVTTTILRNSKDFEIEVTGQDWIAPYPGFWDAAAGVGQPPEGGYFEGFKFEPTHDEAGNEIILTDDEIEDTHKLLEARMEGE